MRKVSCGRQRFVGAAALFISVLLTGCGGGSSPAPPPPPPPPSTITSVSISADSTSLRVGQQFHFTVVVQGTGNFNASVTWSVNGIAGGDAINGTVSSSGTYSAPATLPPTNPVTVTATSVQDPTKSGSAPLNIFTLAINPASATVFYNHTQQFTATVTGITNAAFVWLADHGTVDANGLYTPPLTISPNATDAVYVNVANAGGSSVTAPITLQIPTPVLSSIAPNGASAYELVTINGQDLLGVQQVFFPGQFGTTLSATFQPVSTAQVTANVPLGAVSGPVYMTLQPATGINNTSNSINFTRLPNLRIRAGAKDLSSGETVQFTHQLLGASSPSTVVWTADLGNVSTSGLFQAPVVSQESFATVIGCLQNTRSCDATMLRILPLRIAPATPVVSLGQNVQLDAVEGAQVSANWSVLAGGGSLTSSGLFTAPMNPAQAGGVPVSATAGSVSGIASIAVTGAFPGLVSRTYDYMNRRYDPTTQKYLQNMEGTLVRNLAVSGNRAYTLDLGIRSNPPIDAKPPFTAVDVYDISDPINPAWVNAAESISDRASLFSTYSHYLFVVDVGTIAGSIYNLPSRIGLYDVQSGQPQLLAWITTPDLYSAYDNNGVIYGAPLNPYTGSTAPIYLFDTTGGTIQQREIDLPPPASAVAGYPPYAVIGTGNFVYTEFSADSGGSLLSTYDVSVSPPNLLASVPIDGTFISRANLLIRNNLLFIGNAIFDISAPVPTQVGTLPIQSVLDVQGTRLLGAGFMPIYAARDNCVLVDITDPANPVLKASIYDLPDAVGLSGKFVGNGNTIVTDEALGGVGTIDLTTSGGLVDKARVSVFPDGFIFDHTINQQIMYVAGASALGSGGLVTFDLSTGTPIFSGALLYGQNEGLAVQVAGSKAFLGLLDNLKTIDVSNPASPSESGSVALPTNALVLSGNTLFVGTGDGRLVVLDVTNPNSPSTLGSVPLPAAAVNLRLAGSTLLVADGSAGLLIFDVSNHAVPKQLSQLPLNTPVWDIAADGTLVFLAADSTGLAIVDISNPLQPKQISQTTLESWNPFPYFGDGGPRSVALSVATQNGLVYVGTANSLGLVFAFDYSQPSYPRLVSMNAFGEFIDTLTSGFSFVGSDIYVFGALGVDDDIVQSDDAASRNAINLYYPPLALRGIDFSPTQSATGKTHDFMHPKFDRKIFQRRHRYLRGQHPSYETQNND